MLQKELLFCNNGGVWVAEVNITVGYSTGYMFGASRFGFSTAKFGAYAYGSEEDGWVVDGSALHSRLSYTSMGACKSIDNTVNNPKVFTGSYGIGLLASPASISYSNVKEYYVDGINAPILQLVRNASLGLTKIPTNCRLTRLDNGATVTSDQRVAGYSCSATNGVPSETKSNPIYSYEITSSHDARRIIFESEYGQVIPIQIELFD